MRRKLSSEYYSALRKFHKEHPGTIPPVIGSINDDFKAQKERDRKLRKQAKRDKWRPPSARKKLVVRKYPAESHVTAGENPSPAMAREGPTPYEGVSSGAGVSLCAEPQAQVAGCVMPEEGNGTKRR
jgi:hypothetical protein